MDFFQLFSSALGLGFIAGIRLYATVFILGAAIRFEWLQIGPGQEHWRVLGEPTVITVAGAAFLIEFFADKVPWLDSLWDSLHTFIRPVGAAILGGVIFGEASPAVQAVIWLLCGGVALTSHSAKAASRLAVNQSPEPFSNILLSLVEDAFAFLGVWLAVTHALLMLALVVVFLSLFAWLSPKIYRRMRLQVTALRAWLLKPKRT